MTTVIKGQPTSAEIRTKLATEQRTVLVAMSLGKDAIATELALQDAGIHTELAYLYYIPGHQPGTTLDFIETTIRDLEQALGKPIHRYPHPSLYRWLRHLMFQPPERIQTIEAAQLPDITYEEEWEYIREDLGLPPDTWVADGVRAADSIVRRASLSRHGLMKPNHHKVSPIADWLKAEVMDRIDQAGISLPIDYQWFGRSFDGLDYRFLHPLQQHAPEDFQRVLDWFPLADLEILRHDLAA